MNGACSCRENATPGTPASTIINFFKFPKPPRECLEQLVKSSSQSDERCGLLYEADTQTDIHFLYIRYIYIYLLIRKATGSYRTYSIPGTTAALIPEFAMEDLPSAELQPRFLRLQ